MELDDRAKIETFLQSHESALDLPPVQEGETIFEYVVDSNGKLNDESVSFYHHKYIMRYQFFSLTSLTLQSDFVFLEIGNWEHWLQRVEEYIYPSDSVPEFSSILVPNVDNVRSNFLIDTIAKQHKVTWVVTWNLVRVSVITLLIWSPMLQVFLSEIFS